MRKGKQALWAAIGVVALRRARGAATGLGADGREAAPFKAAWIYVGPHNDGGWSQAHDAGPPVRRRRQLGSKVETTYKENVPEGPQAAQVIESLVRDGNKIIFATSFGFQDAMVAAAKKYPDVQVRDGDRATQTSKNMAEYFGAGEDAIYLSGMAAARRRRRA